MPDTQTIPRPSTRPLDDTVPDHGWKVILFNDDIHDMDTVILAVQRAAGISVEVATMITLEAHEQGSAVVKRQLSHDDALVVCGGLRRWTRSEQQPGVDCEAIPDSGD